MLEALLAAPGVDLAIRYHDSSPLELARAAGNSDAAELLLNAAPVATPGGADDAVSVRVCNVLTEDDTGPFALCWGARVRSVLQLYAEQTGTAIEQVSLYFEVADGVREPKLSLSAEQIPGCVSLS